MGYFNYFIKCIIRKFVNLLFKPKMFLVLLVIVGLLFAMQISSRAEWTDDDINYLFESFSNITSNQGTIISQLSNIGVDVENLKTLLNETNTELETIRSNTFMINSNLIKVINNLNTISTNISNIYTKLDENQKELLTELEKDNQAVLEELNMIRDAINGTENESASYNDLGCIVDSTGSHYMQLRKISLNYESRYTYTLKVYYTNPSSTARGIFIGYSDNLIPDSYYFGDYEKYFGNKGTLPGNATDFVFNYDIPSSNPKYIYLNWNPYITRIEVYRSIKGITESLNQSNDLQQQQNQIQQEQNQLQQEQNDFLKQEQSDSDVSVDSFNSVDSNDITSAGLSGVFNNIYSSITSWSSKDIVLPIPKINKSITIPANYTENMMSKVGGGRLVNIIHTVYYFIVARFIIYSITGIINSIKSGSILETDTKNNITTDML